MKIAIVSDAVYPYHKGGKERRFHELTVRLAARGHDLHIYTMKWWKSPEQTRVEEGVTLHAISPLYKLYSGERRSIVQGIMFGVHCLKLIRESWDVIEVDHMPYFPLYFTRIVCWLKRKPMFATWNEVWGKDYWIYYMGLSGIIAFLIEYLSIFLPDRFLAISQHTAKRLQSVYGVPEPKVKQILTGLDIHSIDEVKPSTITSDILFAGRMLKHKNIDLLIHAIHHLKKEVPDIQCLIVGNGPEKRSLMRLTERLNLQENISFLSFLPHHSEVFALMKSSGVFAFPSTREGFGMAVLEANACGIPAVVINHPENAAQDLIQTGKNGSIVNGADAALFAKALLTQLKRYRTNREEVSKTVRRIAEKYEWETIVTRLEKEYTRV
jgi:glycosyltransferase involved in cell wall biosynthesis